MLSAKRMRVKKREEGIEKVEKDGRKLKLCRKMA